MIRIITLALCLSFTSMSFGGSSEKFCNKLGGDRDDTGKDDNFYAYQMCDFLTGRPVTPLGATAKAAAEGPLGWKNKEGYTNGFELTLYKDRLIVTHETYVRMSGLPVIRSVLASIDNGDPFEFKVVNYGFGGHFSSVDHVVRQAVIEGDTYTWLSEKIKKGRVMRVIWVEKDGALGRTASYTMQFFLDDSTRMIDHVSKDIFRQ